MKKIQQLILSLTLISAVCAAVLAIVNAATKERIASLDKLKAQAAAREVMPGGVKAIEESGEEETPQEDPDAAEEERPLFGHVDRIPESG